MVSPLLTSSGAVLTVAVASFVLFRVNQRQPQRQSNDIQALTLRVNEVAERQTNSNVRTIIRHGKPSDKISGVKSLFKALATDYRDIYVPLSSITPLDFFDGGGGFSTVKGAILTRASKQIAVVYKEVREHIITADAGKANYKDPSKRLIRELRIWSKLKHDNILPLLAFTISEETPFPILISEYKEDGSLRDFLRVALRGGPQNRKTVDYCRILKGIASGLEYLHSHGEYYEDYGSPGDERQGIIHGDVKGTNILMDKGTPLLSDFGTAHVLNPGIVTLQLGTEGTGQGSPNWLAYEIVNPSPGGNSGYYTKCSDIWSFGMTVYETVIANNPYHEIQPPMAIITRIQSGKTPIWPQDVAGFAGAKSVRMDALHEDVRNLVGPLKNLCTACWKLNPEGRPTMKKICEEMEKGFENMQF